MKPILGIAVLLTWFARCDDHGIELPDPHHPHGPYAGQSGSSDEDAGVEEQPSHCTPTDLYQPNSCDDRHSPCYGLRKYTPKYELWADGADKERFIYLPPGTTIDTSNPDRWNFPKNTKIFKTFSIDGLRLETRVMTKLKDGAGFDNWEFGAWLWNLDQTEATLQVSDDYVTGGATDVLGTKHDVPKPADCKTCHTVAGADAVNGFGAIQLNDSSAGYTLRELLAEKRLSNTQAVPISVDNARLPGNSETRAALGYLHSNCGHCHSASTKSGLQLWAKTATDELCAQPAYRDGVGVCLGKWWGHAIPDRDPAANFERRIVARDAAASGVIGRMSSRVKADQMPKLGTELVDDEGVALVSNWIAHLPIDSCLPRNPPLAACEPPPPPPPAGAGGSAATTGGAGGASGAAAGAGGG